MTFDDACAPSSEAGYPDFAACRDTQASSKAGSRARVGSAHIVGG